MPEHGSGALASGSRTAVADWEDADVVVSPRQETSITTGLADLILIVDDEPNVISSVRRLLRPDGYHLLTASSAEEGLEALHLNQVALVISDNAMPGMTGIEFLHQVRMNWPDAVRIMLTGYADFDSATTAINQGEVYRFVTKPWDPEGLRQVVRQGLDHYRLVQENRRMHALIKEQNAQPTRWNESLQQLVEERTGEIQRKNLELEKLYQQLKDGFVQTIEAIAATVEARDPHTAGHQRRVGALACALAEGVGLSRTRISGLRLAASIHDLGKVVVPAEILSRPGRLNGFETSIIRTHCQVAYDILKNIRFPWPVAQIVLQHHERLDGSGYPQGLSGKGILLEAKILAVADVVEAMASHRPYRPALGIDSAVQEIRENKGALYDPDVVEAFMMVSAREWGELLARST